MLDKKYEVTEGVFEGMRFHSEEPHPHILELDEQVKDLLTRFRICQKAHRAMLSQLQTHADMLDECAKDLDNLRSRIGTIALEFSRSAKTEPASPTSGAWETPATTPVKSSESLLNVDNYPGQPTADNSEPMTFHSAAYVRTPAKSRRRSALANVSRRLVKRRLRNPKPNKFLTRLAKKRKNKS